MYGAEATSGATLAVHLLLILLIGSVSLLAIKCKWAKNSESYTLMICWPVILVCSVFSLFKILAGVLSASTVEQSNLIFLHFLVLMVAFDTVARLVFKKLN